MNNGTSALRLIIKWPVSGQDRSLAYLPSPLSPPPPRRCFGGRGGLLDVDPITGNLTPEILEQVSITLTHLVAVHVAGRLVDLAGLKTLCDQREMVLVGMPVMLLVLPQGMAWSAVMGHSPIGDFQLSPRQNITTAEVVPLSPQ